MNKKVVLGLAVLGLLYWQYGRSNDEEQAVNENNPPNGTDGSPPQTQPSVGNEYFPIEPDPVIYDEFEGKVVYYPKGGNTFVIRAGEKYTVSSEQALDDYISKNPAHSKIPYALTLQEILQYPTAGYLDTGVRFVRT